MQRTCVKAFGVSSHKLFKQMVVLGVLTVSVAACSSLSTTPDGVSPSPYLSHKKTKLTKRVGHRTSSRPYRIGSQVYYPVKNPRGFTQVGRASWYGSNFHGRQTANGEVFDKHAIAAAHPTLPLPSYARVTNLRNHRSMVVRINDRGPYHSNRVIDVSEKVAALLNFKRKGIATVKVEYIGPASLIGSSDRKLMATLDQSGRSLSQTLHYAALNRESTTKDDYAMSAPINPQARVYSRSNPLLSDLKHRKAGFTDESLLEPKHYKSLDRLVEHYIMKTYGAS